MGIKKYNPTSPGKRFRTVSDYAEVTSVTPLKSLLRPLKKTGGRNKTNLQVDALEADNPVVRLNLNDLYDLGGEVEFWIDGKQNIIDRSFLAYLPAGTKHGPLSIRRVDRPIFHFTAGMRGSYV